MYSIIKSSSFNTYFLYQILFLTNILYFILFYSCLKCICNVCGPTMNDIFSNIRTVYFIYIMIKYSNSNVCKIVVKSVISQSLFFKVLLKITVLY